MGIEYSKKVLDHFYNPRNVGVIEDADGVGDLASPVCGDLMRLYLKIEDDVIVEAKFQTFGCAAAIASGSVLTELIKGKTIDEALKITNRRVAEALGGLPPVKLHCSLLAEDALKRAIEDYRRRREDSSKRDEK
jgi:nitrogen fixation NifU-like protein